MTDTDEREAIRRRKAEKLRRSATAGEGVTDETTGASGEATAAPGEPIHVSGSDHLGEIVDRHRIVLADFYADWCGPCQMLEPVVEGLAAETPAAVAKVDIDANQSLAAEYGIQGVPTLILFAEGDPVEQLTGVRDRHRYEQLIDQYAG